MSWDQSDKVAITNAFYHKLYASNPDYLGKGVLKGNTLESFTTNTYYLSKRDQTITYIDEALAGTADPKIIANRHAGRKVGAEEFKEAKEMLMTAAIENGCTTDLGPAVDAIIGSF